MTSYVRRTNHVLLTLLGLLLVASCLLASLALPSGVGQRGLLHSVTLPLPLERALIVTMLPCTPDKPGRVVVWLADDTRQNRFVNGTIERLTQLPTVPACPR